MWCVVHHGTERRSSHWVSTTSHTEWVYHLACISNRPQDTDPGADFVFPREVCNVHRVLAGLSGVSGWFCGGVVLPFFFGLAMDVVCLQCVAA